MSAGINSITQQIAQLAEQARGSTADETPTFPFSGVLAAVQGKQDAASNLVSAYTNEVPGVELHQVMIAQQKAAISFEMLTQTRNKLVSAYQEIANLPL